jgi:predicted O-methyltransferase YrrM
MHLPWRDMPAGPGTPLISTSLTAAEAARLAALADGRDVLEVGSAYGFSACVMALAGAAHVTAVDPHGWLDSYDAMTSNLADAGLSDLVTIVRGTSPGAVAGLGPFGLAFIDGDHSAVAVQADVEAALAVLAPGGTLAMHDLGEDCCCPGVRQALEALFPDGPSEQVDTLAVYEGLA